MSNKKIQGIGSADRKGESFIPLPLDEPNEGSWKGGKMVAKLNLEGKQGSS
ncbi:hypothetical protein LCGC14_2005510 [marine sediment metagenome]|uniref:Uncharacterized protein n=1 Tax=marine sediment metagenome TaxID=412755 RepID=A0A0F9F1Z9_9ZZZZ